MKRVQLAGTGAADRFDVVDVSEPSECLTLTPAFRKERNLPPVKKGDLIHVKVTHFSINYADVCIRMGLYASANRYASDPAHLCPGFDFAGSIVDAGDHSDEFRVGARVFGVMMFGAYSTDVLVPHHQVFHTPSHWSDAEAAAFPAAAITAYYAIYKSCGVRSPTLPTGLGPGSTVLVHSAAGGVGRYICNLATRLGASVVGVVGRESKVSTLLSDGAGGGGGASRSGGLPPPKPAAASAARGAAGAAPFPPALTSSTASAASSASVLTQSGVGGVPRRPPLSLASAVVVREAVSARVRKTAPWYARWPFLFGEPTTRWLEHAVFTAAGVGVTTGQSTTSGTVNATMACSASGAGVSGSGGKGGSKDVGKGKSDDVSGGASGSVVPAGATVGGGAVPWHERLRGAAASLLSVVFPPPPRVFDFVFDANGASTLGLSYDATKAGGTLVTYGFHSFLPQDGSALSISSWIPIIKGVVMMPRFAPMNMTERNITVSGFNLSFLFDQRELLEHAMSELLAGAQVGDGEAQPIFPPLVSEVFGIHEVPAAHKALQSGRTVGKIVIATGV